MEQTLNWTGASGRNPLLPSASRPVRHHMLDAFSSLQAHAIAAVRALLKEQPVSHGGRKGGCDPPKNTSQNTFGRPLAGPGVWSDAVTSASAVRPGVASARCGADGLLLLPAARRLHPAFCDCRRTGRPRLRTRLRSLKTKPNGCPAQLGCFTAHAVRGEGRTKIRDLCAPMCLCLSAERFRLERGAGEALVCGQLEEGDGRLREAGTLCHTAPHAAAVHVA